MQLTEMLDDVVYCGLKEGIHSFWTHPQHSLRRPFHKIHTKRRCESISIDIIIYNSISTSSSVE